MNLLTVLPYCSKDSDIAELLLDNIAFLDPQREVPPHNILLVTDSSVDRETIRLMKKAAQAHFTSVETMIVPLKPEENTWPKASTLLFRAAANQIEQCYKDPWLWLEPDCVPLCRNWLEELKQAYRYSPKKFMGHIVTADQLKEGVPHMAGPAIYPNNAFTILKDYLNGNYFDLDTAPIVLPRSSDTPLIQHFWGTPKLSPTFKAEKRHGDPENTLTLDFIKPGAVLFHRCKDGSLFNLLKSRIMPVRVDEASAMTTLPTISEARDNAEPEPALTETEEAPAQIDISEL